MSEQTIVMFGAGSAGLGIADLICTAMAEDDGISKEEARKRVYLVDSRGLVVKGRSTGGISKEKEPYAHAFPKEIKALDQIVKETKATCLIGVSGQPKVFNEATCRQMA